MQSISINNSPSSPANAIDTKATNKIAKKYKNFIIDTGFNQVEYRTQTDDTLFQFYIL